MVVALLAAWMRPGHFRGIRTQTVQAPADRRHSLIADLRQFNTWNPFAGDPAMQGDYRGPATDVTWSMEGQMPFIVRLVGLFINMDRDIGTQFENGLSALQLRAEAR